jgi:phenylalanyl-tRNA synthetase beta subunit
MKPLAKYPEYYCVDFEIFVKLIEEGNKIIGYNHLCSPYPIGKAISEGQKITKAQYEKGVKDYLRSEKLKETKFQNWLKKKKIKFNKRLKENEE